MTNNSWAGGRRFFTVFVGLLVALGLGPSLAKADFSGQLIAVEAVNSQGRGTWQVAIPANPPDNIQYTHPDRVELRDPAQNLIGIVDNVSVNLQGDPVASITFTATAGSFPTTFSISSAVVGFPAILNPTGNASASVTLTDSSTNGASLTPVAPNTGAFLPTYNGSTLFFPLIGPQTISSGGSVTASEGTGDQPIAGSVSSIQARFNFTLSATDVASGTGRFEVIPEPGTVSLAAIGALLAGVTVWRRRARSRLAAA